MAVFYISTTNFSILMYQIVIYLYTYYYKRMNFIPTRYFEFSNN